MELSWNSWRWGIAGLPWHEGAQRARECRHAGGVASSELPEADGSATWSCFNSSTTASTELCFQFCLFGTYSYHCFGCPVSLQS